MPANCRGIMCTILDSVLLNCYGLLIEKGKKGRNKMGHEEWVDMESIQ